MDLTLPPKGFLVGKPTAKGTKGMAWHGPHPPAEAAFQLKQTPDICPSGPISDGSCLQSPTSWPHRSDAMGGPLLSMLCYQRSKSLRVTMQQSDGENGLLAQNIEENSRVVFRHTTVRCIL